MCVCVCVRVCVALCADDATHTNKVTPFSLSRFPSLSLFPPLLFVFLRYGDAIAYELIPHIEREFRAIGQGWARATYGGSTGGWESLAVQLLYPDMYNGCWTFCPDPISFQAYTTVNIYADENAYVEEKEEGIAESVVCLCRASMCVFVCVRCRESCILLH